MANASPAAPKYLLGYWEIRGLAAVPRMLFALADVPVQEELHRLELDEAGKIIGSSWGARAKELAATAHPYANLPFLQVTETDAATGKEATLTLVQSNAINRFLAARFGFVPATTNDAAFADEVLEHLVEMKAELNFLAYRTPDFAADQSDFDAKSVPYYLHKLEKRLAMRSTGQNALGANADAAAFLSGAAKPCWQDLYTYEVCQVADAATNGKALADTPLLAALCAKVRALPALQAYFASAPATMAMNNWHAKFGHKPTATTA